MAFDPKTWADGELITAEDLNRLEQAADAVDAKAEATGAKADATAEQVDKIKLANASVGEGAPTGTAPVGWHYTDLATGDVYRMDAAGWVKRPRAAVVEDVRHLVAPGWEVARARIGRSAGGVVTLTVLNINRVETATGMTDLLALPSRLAPTDHLYGTRTYRGNELQFLGSGLLSIYNPALTSLDHLYLTYVPKGGA